MKFHTVIILPCLVLLISNVMAVDKELKVTANIAASCEIDSASDIDFEIAAGSTPVTADGSVNVKCTVDSPWTLTINEGTNTSGVPPQMKEVGGDSLLPYTDTLEKSSGVGTGANELVKVTGELTRANINAAKAGSYEDTLTVTLNPG